MMDSSSKFFFSFSVNYAMIVKLVDLIVLLGSKLLNRFQKFSTISGFQTNDICNDLGFNHWVRVEALDFSDCIWILWKDLCHIEIIKTHPQFIHFQDRREGTQP